MFIARQRKRWRAMPFVGPIAGRPERTQLCHLGSLTSPVARFNSLASVAACSTAPVTRNRIPLRNHLLAGLASVS